MEEEAEMNFFDWKPKTVKELAVLGGVSVRTLHHYDEIGLLSPAGRTESGYRIYGEAEFLRLQQILLYKEMGLSLEDIRNILDAKNFDLETALLQHRDHLRKEQERMNALLKSVERTLQAIQEAKMLKIEDLYEGFSPETREAYRKEAGEKYGIKMVEDTENRVSRMNREEWFDVKQAGERITKGIAALMDRDPADRDVQALIAEHHDYIEIFYPCSMEIYRGLAALYVEDERFTAYYEKYAPGLAHFMKRAMIEFADSRE